MGNWDNHCPNCFTEKPAGNRQCQHCGYDEQTSRSPAALPVRAILHDQFMVGRVLGNPGGFGITYLCWDIKLRMRVAIKEFMPRDNAVRDTDRCSVVAHSGKDQEFFEYGLNAFLAEAQTVAGFNHPNIVRIRAYFEQNHTAYLVMDYYEGVSLAEYVKQQGGSLPEKAALGIMGFVLDGLRHVHDSGYLHRDIKPANIYLTGKGQVILLDFGAARYAIGEYSRSLSVVVTPGFSPFEQYSTKGAQGTWTDIYAVGATLYFMLTGQPPDSAPDRMISDTLIGTVQQAPGLSPDVKQWIIRSMRVKSSDRPQNVTEFGAGLRSCQPALTQPMPVPLDQPPVPGRQEVLKKDVWAEPITGMEFVWIPGGTFDMGSPDGEKGRQNDEGPVHRVDVDGFWMGKTEVTNAQYRKWKSGHSSSNYEGISLNGDTQPVVFVSWEDARDFAQWLSRQSGGKYTFKLPSEAQWEYACRGGTKTSRYWGDNPDLACTYANVADQKTKARFNWSGTMHNFSGEYEVTAPVASFEPNAFGLYDMLGNVWEWCEDVYLSDRYRKPGTSINPIYTSGGPFRVIRGGGWSNEPDYVRCAVRYINDPADRLFYLGFRLLRMP